jgi:hypothetical protein
VTDERIQLAPCRRVSTDAFLVPELGRYPDAVSRKTRTGRSPYTLNLPQFFQAMEQIAFRFVSVRRPCAVAEPPIALDPLVDVPDVLAITF